MHTAEQYILASPKAGVEGYVLKDVTRAELKVAISNVLNGKSYFEIWCNASLSWPGAPDHPEAVDANPWRFAALRPWPLGLSG